MVADELDLCSVMVVEDDHDIRNALMEFLEFQGYRVCSASHGREAFEILRSCDELPALILLDLMMPVMNGWEFCEQRQDDPDLGDIPVVVISADAQLCEKARSLGAVDWIPKPINVSRLVEVLERYCP